MSDDKNMRLVRPERIKLEAQRDQLLAQEKSLRAICERLLGRKIAEQDLSGKDLSAQVEGLRICVDSLDAYILNTIGECALVESEAPNQAEKPETKLGAKSQPTVHPVEGKSVTELLLQHRGVKTLAELGKQKRSLKPTGLAR